MNGQLSTSVKSPRILGAVAMTKANLYNPNVLTMVGLTLMALALMFMPSTHAEAVDLFTKGRTNIKDTFGLSSTVVWILYIIEGLGAVFTYTKTKNLAVFGGIAAVMVFVNVLFGIIP
ncbi:type IV conjugative transfer system pilin TraA [Cedecea sp.]|jgi:type IV conjugative transfer system pilin TraA|uniref:type IV conjugative transfer system pilin TraA n=1 Tax=Cedecea sp. TaxID=1970739 RepID=UPI002F3E2E9C